jgi:hypothetical protein
LFHRRKPLAAIVPLVIVLLAFAGCSTNPATNITSSSAYLNGDGGCPGAGISFTWYYNLWDSEDNIYNGPQYYANCSGQSPVQALPSIQFGDLLTGTDHCFAIHAWLQTPHGEFMHFDADGTKNGYHFDCFATQALSLPGSVQVPPTGEAGAAGPPSEQMKSRSRSIAKSYWSSNGRWTSCMANNTRQTSASPSQKMRFYDNQGRLIVTSFNRIQKIQGLTGAVSIGCASPAIGSANNPDARIVYNEGIFWGLKSHCLAGVHEFGHQSGLEHFQFASIMNVPLPSNFAPCN